MILRTRWQAHRIQVSRKISKLKGKVSKHLIMNSLTAIIFYVTDRIDAIDGHS